MEVTLVQVRSDSLVVYNQPVDTRWKRHQFNKMTSKTYSGTVTGHTRKRLASALDILVQKTPVRRQLNHHTGNFFDFRMAFITLTQPPDILLDAKECYELLLKDWLVYMKRKMGMKQYVWKWEKQKNGQGHYHIATNCYIPWESVRWRWNKQLRKAGQLEGYALRHGGYKPPSSEIKSMVKVDDCLMYCQKEICKGVQNAGGTNGKIWDCSDDLKMSRFSDFLDWETWDKIQDGIQHGFVEIVELDRCTVYKMAEPKAALSDSLLTGYEEHFK